MKKKKAIRIGGASAFLGDSSIAVPQLIKGGEVDYIIMDYLAEVTMSYLARS
ncbi:MAG: acyclic terpene utilization AtuA family protein, partial [Deltaproteobacteria bacterium]|nr:acyclic terpene utilization AtuA family protein [Deltaproteobacteria bacterium]